MDFEQVVLGTIISTQCESFWLKEEDFSTISNRNLFKLIERLRSEGKLNIVDLINESELSQKEIIELSSSWWSVELLPTYVKRLKELTRWRLASAIGKQLQDWDISSPSHLLQIADKLKQISTIGTSIDSVKRSDVQSAFDLVIERMGKSLYGYSWWKNFGFLDEMTKGLIKRQIYRIWAPSGVGKTQMVYNIIPELLAQKNPDGSDVKVAFFTLENTKESTLTSIMCKHEGINFHKLSKGDISWNWDYLVWLENRLFVIDNQYELSDIFSTILAIKPDVVILDYISYVTIKGFTEESKYAEYARLIVPFAKENDLVWIDLSNLPKSLQTNEEIRFRPWFHGSALLVNNSDVNLHIMRNEEFMKAKNKVLGNKFDYSDEDVRYFYSRNMLDCVITKNRWWPPGAEVTYAINQDNWGVYKELDKSQLDALFLKFG